MGKEREMEVCDMEVMVADESHEKYVDTILDTIEAAAKVRGTGIAKRSHEYVAQKMREGKVIIALAGDEFAGFSYIESWGNKQYVATSGLIVADKFRNHGLARRIKHAAFQLARLRWPKAKLFSLTSGSAVMKMNTELGYFPVTFADLTDDESFWRGCNGCVNHDVLTRTQRRYCICTAMLFDPDDERCLLLEKLCNTFVKKEARKRKTDLKAGKKNPEKSGETNGKVVEYQILNNTL
jgi:GNAT superfamily N-acetyltransferase